jgi:hypothetical protein
MVRTVSLFSSPPGFLMFSGYLMRPLEKGFNTITLLLEEASCPIRAG